jgi:hypothetical protein
MDATLPAFDATAALTVHVQARATAERVRCTNAACLEATGSHHDCTCAECGGEDHGSGQDRTGLMPAAPRSVAPGPSHAMRSLVATMPAADVAPAPHRVAPYVIHLDPDEVW